MDTSIDLMQHAAVGAVIGIIISLIPVAIYLAGAAKRDEKREAKRELKLKKKEAKKAEKVGEKVVQEENQELQKVKKVQKEMPQVKQQEVINQAQQPNQVEASLQQVEKASHLQEEEKQVVSHLQEEEEQVVSQLQEEEEQVVSHLQEEEKQVQLQNQEPARVQTENLQQAEVASSPVEEPQLEKIISQLKQKSEELVAEQYKQFSEDNSLQEQSTQVVPLESYTEESLPVILNFYKVNTTQKEENKRFVLDGYLTIGRNTGYHHWTIEGDMTVSGNHCKIYERNKEIYLLDLNSTNGTYINGKRVRGEMKLSNHDKIRIGQGEYRLGL